MAYWPQQPQSFETRATAAEMAVANQMLPRLANNRRPHTIPAKTYTAEPGTGGNMNMTIPIAKTNTVTIRALKSAKTPFNQENNTNVAFPPSRRTTKRTPRRHTFEKIVFQLQVRIDWTTRSPAGVKLAEPFSAVPLHTRIACRKRSRTRKAGTSENHTKMAMALNKSECKNFAAYLTIMLPRANSDNNSSLTSNHMKRSNPKMASKQNVVYTCASNGDTPARYHKDPPRMNIRNVMMARNCRRMPDTSRASFK
mmetsp:Transcript_103279/g.298747  ORF Transcript_103279/g.298747 Transcript_103279/m.298747 type:complete len:254 (-) Transcript_103279:563-1324(-)